MAHSFEIYKDKAGEFRVRFKYNAETIFSTEGYKAKSSPRTPSTASKKMAPVRRRKTIAATDTACSPLPPLRVGGRDRARLTERTEGSR